MLGFVLMWPIGWLFGAMSWPVFHGWGLAHGAWIIAWPVLTLFSFLVLYLLGRAAKRRHDANSATGVRPDPTVIGVLPNGFVVDHVSLAATSELQAYVIEHNIREVRVVLLANASYARVEETLVSLQGLGLSFGILGSEAP